MGNQSDELFKQIKSEELDTLVKIWCELVQGTGVHKGGFFGSISLVVPET
jgi:hypothetical protein